MSPEVEYFKQFSIWKKVTAWFTGTRPRVESMESTLRCRFHVEYTNEKFELFSGSVRSVSGDGIRFAAESPLRKGTIIELKIVFPDEFGAPSPIFVKSVVRHSVRPPGRRRFRVGCKFVGASPVDHAKLCEFLRWNEAALVAA